MVEVATEHEEDGTFCDFVTMQDGLRQANVSKQLRSQFSLAHSVYHISRHLDLPKAICFQLLLLSVNYLL